ncbi:MAG: SPASM domain-containing protein [Cetobacterium sp.]
MMDPNFYTLIEYMSSLEIVPLVYASGTEIKTLDGAKSLEKLGISIMLKYNTEINSEVDKIVGKDGYGSHAKNVFDWLIEAGFNKGEQTRLGINVVITALNKEERENFFKLYKFCRENNIYLHGQSLIPKGNAKNENMLIHKEEALSILNTTCCMDKELYDIEYNVVPPITSGFRCRKVNVGLFVNIFGEVWDCNGSGRKIGDIRQNTLGELWNSELAKNIRKPLQEGRCHLREYWWNGEKNGI